VAASGAFVSELLIKANHILETLLRGEIGEAEAEERITELGHLSPNALVELDAAFMTGHMLINRFFYEMKHRADRG
jgi:hypothetical protein